jgi:hypothetical protein
VSSRPLQTGLNKAVGYSLAAAADSAAAAAANTSAAAATTTAAAATAATVAARPPAVGVFAFGRRRSLLARPAADTARDFSARRHCALRQDAYDTWQDAHGTCERCSNEMCGEAACFKWRWRIRNGTEAHPCIQARKERE